MWFQEAKKMGISEKPHTQAISAGSKKGRRKTLHHKQANIHTLRGPPQIALHLAKKRLTKVIHKGLSYNTNSLALTTPPPGEPPTDSWPEENSLHSKTGDQKRTFTISTHTDFTEKE